MSDNMLQKDELSEVEKQQLKISSINEDLYKADDFQTGQQVSDFIEKSDYSKQNFNNKEFVVKYNSIQEQRDTEALLRSDDALIRYYQRTKPDMLNGLKSKNFFNFPGKKAEKKALRQKHLEKLEQNRKADEEHRKAELIKSLRANWKGDDIKNMNDEDVIKHVRDTATANISEYYTNFENTTADQTAAITAKVFKMSPLNIMRYELYIQKLKVKKVRARTDSPLFKEYNLFLNSPIMQHSDDDKDFYRRNYLFQAREDNKEEFIYEILNSGKYDKFLNDDKYGNDSPEVQEEQTKVAQLYNPNLDYKAFRLRRRIMDAKQKHELPTAIKQNAKYAPHNLDSVCRVFMKPVKYKPGTRIPETKMDEQNLAFNEMWTQSLISENEEDWNFRFDKMEDFIVDSFDKYENDIKTFITNIDEKKILDNIEMINDDMAQILAMNGVDEYKEQNDLFNSKYFKKHKRSWKNEVKKKYDIMIAFADLIHSVCLKNGVNTHKASIAETNETQNIDQVISQNISKLQNLMAHI